MKDLEYMESFVDDAIVTCDEIQDTPRSVIIIPSDEINYWLNTVFLLAIACLLLLVVIVKYYIKRESTIPCILSYHCRDE